MLPEPVLLEIVHDIEQFRKQLLLDVEKNPGSKIFRIISSIFNRIDPKSNLIPVWERIDACIGLLAISSLLAFDAGHFDADNDDTPELDYVTYRIRQSIEIIIDEIARNKHLPPSDAEH